MPIIPLKRTKRKSDPAAELAWQIEHGLGLLVQREFRFHPTRKWRFDLALECPRDDCTTWRFAPLAIEIEGGFFLKDGGRHTRGAGARGDCEKYNEAVLCEPPWRILRVLPEWVPSGVAFSLVERAVKRTKER